MSTLPGSRIPIVASPVLPLAPSHRTDARRLVRHGMADVLAWLGEDVGPKPGEPIQALLINGTLHASAALVEQMQSAATR